MSRIPHLQSSMRMGLLKTVKMGGSLDALVKDAKVVSQSQGQGYASTGYDLNGDGMADLWRTDSFDANGKATSSGYSLHVDGKNGGTDFSVYDTNADGKIDSLSRYTASGSRSISDEDHDGKADALWYDYRHGGKETTSHSFMDLNHDGKVDYRSDTRAAKATDVFQAAPVVDGFSKVALDASIDDVLAGATQLSAQDSGTYRTENLDLNGDGKTDLIESDYLDANGKLTGRYFSAYQTDANGVQTYEGGFGADPTSGKINWVAGNASENYRAAYDNNLDGKIDYETLWNNGVQTILNDVDHDGKVDQVTTAGQLT